MLIGVDGGYGGACLHTNADMMPRIPNPMQTSLNLEEHCMTIA